MENNSVILKFHACKQQKSNSNRHSALTQKHLIMFEEGTDRRSATYNFFLIINTVIQSIWQN
jgi:hypothetical protein